MIPDHPWWNDAPKIDVDGRRRIRLYGGDSWGPWYAIDDPQVHSLFAKMAYNAKREGESLHPVYAFIAGAYEAGKRKGEQVAQGAIDAVWEAARDEALVGPKAQKLRLLGFLAGLVAGGGITLAVVAALWFFLNLS